MDGCDEFDSSRHSGKFLLSKFESDSTPIAGGSKALELSGLYSC